MLFQDAFRHNGLVDLVRPVVYPGRAFLAVEPGEDRIVADAQRAMRLDGMRSTTSCITPAT